MAWSTPKEIFETMVVTGEKKIHNAFFQTFWLGVLGGAYIALGSLLYTVSITGTSEVLGYGLSRLIGGVSFSLGLILVVVAGAELFTGNILIFADAVERKVSWSQLLRNWLIVYGTNALGAGTVVLMAYYAGLYGGVHGAALGQLGETAVHIAEKKVHLTGLEIFLRGMMANWFVCLAVYIGMAGQDIVSKIVGIVFPVMAFVAIGLEHSIANMYLLTAGAILTHGHTVTSAAVAHNLLFATIGNIIGGLLVAVIYFIIYGTRGHSKT